jgi:thioredoxin-dependent adenylylsulfate APS reductase
LGEFTHFESATAADVVAWAARTFGSRFAIATSFQKEGMIILDIASRIGGDVRVFTLDTGRLPVETLSMIDTVCERYGIPVEIVRPDATEVKSMVAQHGADLFYESLENRQLCCEIRKVRPLERKLRELEAWAAGLRRQQSDTRSQIGKVERVDGRVKIHPLADWTSAQVEDYIRECDVPVHPLYARGYATIGCAPCTRAIRSGEGERAGRWWWEQAGHKECGIHFSPDGKVQRA